MGFVPLEEQPGRFVPIPEQSPYVEPSWADAAKYVGESILEGGRNFAGLAADALNPGASLTQKLMGKETGGEQLNRLISKTGIATPDSDIVGRPAEYVRSIGNALSTPGGPVSNALAALSMEGAKDMGAGPVGQFATGIPAGMIPGVAKGLVNKLRPSVIANRTVGRFAKAVQEGTGADFSDEITNTKRMEQIAGELGDMREGVRAPASAKFEEIKNADDVNLAKTTRITDLWHGEQGDMLPPKIKAVQKKLTRSAPIVEVVEGQPEGVVPDGFLFGPRGESIAMKSPVSIPPSEALALRRELGKMKRGTDATTAKIAGEISEALDEDLAAKFTPEQIESFESATKEWATLKNTYDKGVIGDILKSDANLTKLPGKLTADSKQAERLMRVTEGKPELQKKIKTAVLADLLASRQPASWKNAVSRKSDALTAYFGKDGYEKLSTLLGEDSPLMRNKSLLEKAGALPRIALSTVILTKMGLPWEGSALLSGAINGRSAATKTALNETTRQILWDMSRGKSGITKQMGRYAGESFLSDISKPPVYPVIGSIPFGTEEPPDSVMPEENSKKGVDVSHNPHFKPIKGENPVPVTETLLKGVRKIESGDGKYLVSPTGAKGPYQFMDKTWKEWSKKVGHEGASPMEEEPAKKAAEGYLNWLLKKFDNNIELALTAYNAGPGTVDRALAKSKTKNLKSILPHLTPEAQKYADKVLKEVGKISSVV